MQLIILRSAARVKAGKCVRTKGRTRDYTVPPPFYMHTSSKYVQGTQSLVTRQYISSQIQTAVTIFQTARNKNPSNVAAPVPSKFLFDSTPKGK